MQGALASVETQSGDVVALIGGYQFGDSHFNRATQARRQPGSSFKPVVLLHGPGLRLHAHVLGAGRPFVYVNPYTNEVWRPGNYEKNFRGIMPLYEALTLSRNTCTVRLAHKVGISNVIQRAKMLGLRTPLPAGTVHQPRCRGGLAPQPDAGLRRLRQPGPGRAPAHHHLHHRQQRPRALPAGHPALAGPHPAKTPTRCHPAQERGQLRHRQPRPCGRSRHRRQDRHQQRRERCLVRGLRPLWSRASMWASTSSSP